MALLNRLCVTAASAVLIASPGAAVATSLSGSPVQLNAPPAGFYAVTGLQPFDLGAGAFGYAWKEDLIDDLARVQGERILVRVFRSTGATPVQAKPPTRIDQAAADGVKTLLGAQKTVGTTTRLHYALGSPATNRFQIFRQTFLGLAKSGAASAIHTDMLGFSRQPRFVLSPSGAGAFLWRNSLAHSGRAVTAAGVLKPVTAVQVPAGETLLLTQGLTSGFAATTAKLSGAANWQFLGHVYDAALKLLPATMAITPVASTAKLTSATLLRRSDNTVAFLYALENSSGKVDIFGRAYDTAWRPVTPLVRVFAGLPTGTRAPQAAALDDRQILVSLVRTVGTGKVVEYGRLAATLAPTGTTARVGPFPDVLDRGLFRLANGRVLATYSTGGAPVFIQFVTP